MTSKQKAAIKYSIKQKWLKGEITQDEYDDLVDQLQVLATAGASLQDANQALGLTKDSKPKTTPKPAAPAAASGGMTPEEYKKQKSAMFKKVQAGEMTNYAYIQWKKQNDPSKNPAGASSAPAKNPDAMTDAEYKQIKKDLQDMLSDGTMEKDEYDDLLKYLDANKSVWSEQDASIALGFTATPKGYQEPAGSVSFEDAKKGKSSTAAPAASSAPMTQDDLKKLKQQLADKYANGEITWDELNNIGYDLTQAWKNQKTAAEAEKILQGSPAAPAATTPAPTPVVTNNAGANAAAQAEDKLTKELKKIYKQASDEMQQQLKDFIDKYGDQLAEKQALVAAGKMTKAELQAWINGKDKIIELMKSKIEQMSDTMLEANQKAAAMVNGETFGVFAENANYQSYQITKDAKLNLSFAVYDEDAVRKLIMDKPELLPRKIVNGKKDKAWNQKKIAAAVTQGILQGMSIPKLAKRIATDTGYDNMDAMIRYARTAMTGAQNAGRIEALHRAKGLGVKVKKQWLATLDSRTRDSHQQMDGVTVDVDEEFQTPLGSKMQYPGDLAGKPGDIWNCRCTMVYEYEGFENDPTADQRIQYDDYYTTYKDKDGKKHKVYHRTGSSLINNMNYGEWKAAKQSSKLNDLNLAKGILADAQKNLIKHKVNESKVYKDLWKDEVTLADYPAKKASISAKRDYYTAEIDKLNNAIANGESWAKPEKVKELEKKRKLLNEFEMNGELLQKRNDALKQVQDIYDQVGYTKTQATAPTVAQPKAKKAAKKAAGAAKPSGGTSGAAAAQTAPVAQTAAQKGQFAPDAWDAKTKKAAAFYDKRMTADKELRKELDAEWDSMTDEEKYAIWEYTHNSNPMNKPLSGYHNSWDRSNFMGYDKTSWGYEDPWRTIDVSTFKRFGKNGHTQYHKAITDLTKAIEKTEFTKDRWVVRGSDEGGLAGMLEGGGMDFKQAKALFSGSYRLADIKKAVVGKKAINHAFTSTGIAKDAGFSGNIKYQIYCPKGTKGVYAEPQSYYGHTADKSLYKKGQHYSTVGGEAEVILQRGTTFVIRDVKETGSGDYTVIMEVVEQPDYFRNGDEDTYNGGKTRHKK